MFCDLVGSTALSEKLDPEELRSLLHAYRTLCGDVIARYDGVVARYVGDGILTYFGWPAAHEDDAERAVRAALEIVHTVKRASSTENLSVRIGIATGPVVVGETAGAGDQSKLAVGSTPNLAARLQGLAAADQIVIASSTRRLVGSAFELTDLGEHDLKGISEPVHAWRVERAFATESRFDAHRRQRPDTAGGPRRRARSAASPLVAGEGRRGPGGAAVGRTRDRQEPHPECVARAARSRRRAGPALSVLALLREQRLLADHRQLRTDAKVQPRRNNGRETRQAGSADCDAEQPAAG